MIVVVVMAAVVVVMAALVIVVVIVLCSLGEIYQYNVCFHSGYFTSTAVP